MRRDSIKVSNYNLYIERDSDKFLYNTLSGALAEFTDEQWKILEKAKNTEEFSGLEEDFRKDLLYGGFIVNNDEDEFEKIKSLYNTSRSDEGSLGLTICPTLGCNFSCEYCFESSQDNMEKMSHETQNNIVDFIRMKSPKSISLTWFGGEPLLAIDVIESLSLKIKKYCKEEDIPYEAFIITNGYLLNDDIVGKLKEASIHNLQITIDGDEDTHNRKRPLKGGGSTYKRIIENVKKYSDQDFFIHIRVNVDKKNKNSVLNVAEVFTKEELKNISIGLGYIDNINKTYDDSKCLSLEDFYVLSNRFKQEMLGKKSNYREFMDMELNNLPSLSTNVCGADRINSYGISVDGSMRKCWNHFSDSEKSIGSLVDFLEETRAEETIRMEEIYTSGFGSLDKECTSCKLLPACLGGCIDERVKEGTVRCHSLKFQLEDRILDMAYFLRDK